MELLRLLAMFFILLLHANNTVINSFSHQDVLNNPAGFLPYLGIESMANVGVNVFVLISGWFGIRSRWRGLANVVFQPVFYSVLFIITGFVIGIGNPLSMKSIANVLCFTKNYWYIKAYIGLYILAPVLNSFVDSASKKNLEVILILFFAFQFIYGWTDSAPDFYLGYSTISFMGLYLLGRFMKIYRPSYTSLTKSTYLIVFVITVVLLTSIALVAFMAGSSGFIFRMTYAYCNPIVVLQSVVLLLLFQRIQIQSRLVNWAAASCFSVYLIHENINMQQLFRTTAYSIFTNASLALSLIELMMYICAVFVASILLDQVRLFVWKRIETVFPDKPFIEYE